MKVPNCLLPLFTPKSKDFELLYAYPTRDFRLSKSKKQSTISIREKGLQIGDRDTRETRATIIKVASPQIRRHVGTRPSVLTARDRRTTRPGRPESPDDRSLTAWMLLRGPRPSPAERQRAGLVGPSSVSSVGPKWVRGTIGDSEGRKLQFRKVGP